MLPFVGPSYTLPSAQAAAQRTVNMYLLRVETPEKGPFVLQAMPGFSLFGSAEWPPVVPPSLRFDDARNSQYIAGTMSIGVGIN